MTQILDQEYPRTYQQGDPTKGLIGVYVVEAANSQPRTSPTPGKLGRLSAIYRTEEALRRAGYVLVEATDEPAVDR